MARRNINKEKIKNSIEHLGAKYGIASVFYDVVVSFSYMIANKADFEQEREDAFYGIMNKYNENDTEDFIIIAARLLAEYTKPEPTDVLGEIYEELNLVKTKNGQYFTPMEVSRVLANIILKESNPIKEYQKKGYFSISDEACGSGRLLFVAYDKLISKGIASKDLLLIGADVDLLSCCMTYLQFSLMGVNAIIKHQNTLTLKLFDTFYTPAYAHNKELQEKLKEGEKEMEQKVTNFKIKIWETEEDRDDGYAFDYLNTFEKMEDAIKEAKSLMKLNDYACVEVLDNEEKKVYYWSDGKTEELYEKNSITEDSLDL